jgi:N-acetylmuramoyl-L-alanine amidase
MRTINKLTVSLLLSLAAITSIPAKAEDPAALCMAKVIYYEARGESMAGKLAVAKVTLNRMNSGKFPSTVCGVVYQKGQYSWARGKAPKITDKNAWQESLRIATEAVDTGLTELDNFKALYFHSKQVKPNWKFKRLATIGNHVFYIA